MADHGLTHHRLSLEWARLEPQAGQHDDDAIEHYTEVLRAARDAGINIWVCLHHFTLPGWFSDDEGGFVDERARSYFWARHVDWVGETFGDLVYGWKPINEPTAYALTGFRFGVFPPGTTTAGGLRGRARGDLSRVVRRVPAPQQRWQTGRHDREPHADVPRDPHERSERTRASRGPGQELRRHVLVRSPRLARRRARRARPRAPRPAGRRGRLRLHRLLLLHGPSRLCRRQRLVPRRRPPGHDGLRPVARRSRHRAAPAGRRAARPSDPRSTSADSEPRLRKTTTATPTTNGG